MDPTQVDFGGLNWLGLALAVVANMVIGFVWYHPKVPTGKVWMREMKLPADVQPTPGIIVRGLLLMVVGAFLVMFVFAHTVWVYQDAFQNTATGGQAGYTLTIMDGLIGGFFVWLGFFVPPQLTGLAWEGKSWSLFTVNAGYYLVTMLIAGILITTVGTSG